MLQAKQQISNASLNPPLSPFHNRGLRGIWLRVLVATIGFFVVTSGMANTSHAAQAILSWDPPTTNADGTTLTDLAGYKVYYGTTSGTYGPLVDVGTVITYTAANLSDTQSYYFTVTAYNTAGDESGFSNEVFKAAATVDAVPPVISAVTTGSLTSNSAVITWTTNEGSSSQVEYGMTTAYGSSTTMDNTLITSHSVTLNGLSSWTTYHFRVKSQDASGNLATSADYSFTTLTPPDTTAPTGTISINSGATYTNSTSVTLTLSCSDAGSGCYQMRFSNDNTTWSAWETNATSKTWTLASTDGTKTVYVQYKDNAGNISSNYTDTITLDTTAPAASAIGTGNITNTGATISWTTNEAATTQVEYGATTNYGSSSTLNTNLVTSHSVPLTGLSPSTQYHYRVACRDAAGNLTRSSDSTFFTSAPPDTTPPVISSIGSGNITTSTATITWTTNEVATSQVEYGTSTLYGNLSNQDSNLVISHTATLSGLTPDTIYHFRVISTDQSGNKGTSADYNFTTLKVAQPDTPTAISDLRIKSGISTKNTVTLDWTATGADGTVGTASFYDLRISTLKIIEDGITPVQGEINFSNATKVTGLLTPKIAGTLESAQVSQLETNSVYYSAIKAIDDKGNVSTISNVINGDNVPPLPVTAIRQGYTMISFPLIPATPDVQTLLSGIVGTTVELYWWSSTGLGDGGTFTAESNVVPGYGYFLKSNIDTVTLTVAGTAVTDASRTIPLQPGWSIIGNPYPTEVLLRNTYIKKVDTGELKSYEDAVIAGWVSNAIYNYNGSTYEFTLYTDAVLKLWQGYWLAVLQGGQYEIIIYKP